MTLHRIPRWFIFFGHRDRSEPARMSGIEIAWIRGVGLGRRKRMSNRPAGFNLVLTGAAIALAMTIGAPAGAMDGAGPEPTAPGNGSDARTAPAERFDPREIFFNVDGSFGTFSVGRAPALFERRHSLSSDHSRFGVGVSYASARSESALNFWFGGVYQETDSVPGSAAIATEGAEAERSGFHGGVQATIGGFALSLSGYTDEGPGSVLRYDADSLERWASEHNSDGFVAQGSYTIAGRTKVGLRYGESNADATSRERLCPAAFAGCPSGVVESRFQQQAAWTVGVYHDVNSWLKLVAEYTNSDTTWQDGGNQQVDTFSVGGFFFW
jgi:hypothetical protein